jgi:hypothetical protein
VKLAKIITAIADIKNLRDASKATRMVLRAAGRGEFSTVDMHFYLLTIEMNARRVETNARLAAIEHRLGIAKPKPKVRPARMASRAKH